MKTGKIIKELHKLNQKLGKLSIEHSDQYNSMSREDKKKIINISNAMKIKLEFMT